VSTSQKPYKWQSRFKALLPVKSEPAASDFVVELRVAKRWRTIARSEYEVAARRLFEQASYKCPTDILIRLRHGSDVLIKMPANGLERVREQ
jgi:hypothetical protein